MRFKWIAIACALTSAALGLAAGCGLDDTAITAFGSGGVDASILDAPAGSETSTDDGAPSCNAKTCANYPEDCHASLDDGCGKKIDCSAACPDLQACVPDAGAGVDAGFYCNGPPVCLDAGAPGGNCNTLTNPGNGLMTDCGNCTDIGFTCTSNTCNCSGGTTCTGGAVCCITSSGTPNCNDSNSGCCKRKTCAVDYVGHCNAASDDGCGTANLNCSGNCSNGYTCTANNCACTSGTTCGTTCCPNATDVCHPSTTCCAPEATSVTCNGTGAGSYCGNPVPNNCAVGVDCGACATGQICKSPGGCPCKNATCNLGQTCDTGGSGSCSG